MGSLTIDDTLEWCVWHSFARQAITCRCWLLNCGRINETKRILVCLEVLHRKTEKIQIWHFLHSIFSSFFSLFVRMTETSRRLRMLYTNDQAQLTEWTPLCDVAGKAFLRKNSATSIILKLFVFDRLVNMPTTPKIWGEKTRQNKCENWNRISIACKILVQLIEIARQLSSYRTELLIWFFFLSIEKETETIFFLCHPKAVFQFFHKINWNIIICRRTVVLVVGKRNQQQNTGEIEWRDL